MTEHSDLSHIIDDCLELVLSEAASLDHCLSLHPQSATEIAPLLSMAAAVRLGAAAYPTAAATVLSRDMLRAEIRSAAEHDVAQSNSRWPRASALPAGVHRFVLMLGGRGIRTSNDDPELAGMVDTCLRSVMDDGLPLDASLDPFSDRAAEIEPLLTLATESRRTIHEFPDDRSVTRSRRRLANEILWTATGGVSSITRRFALPRLTAGRRLVVAGVAAALVVGAISVSLGRHALPGDLLYPAKLGGEQAQAALTPSASGRAELALRTAYRRADEFSSLLEQGRYADAASAYERLDIQLARAATQVAERPDATERLTLQAELEQIAQATLERLDAVAMASPDRDIAFRLVQTASMSYAAAVELAAASNESPEPGGPPGNLELRIADPGMTDSSFDSVRIEITGIEVQRAGDRSGAWSPILVVPFAFDLSGSAANGLRLAAADLPAGTYTSLRLTLGDVVVTTDGVSARIRPASPTVTIRRPVSIQVGESLTAVLDVDVDRSLRSNGEGELAFEPVIMLRSDAPPLESPTTGAIGVPGGDSAEEAQPLSTPGPGARAEATAPSLAAASIKDPAPGSGGSSRQQQSDTGPSDEQTAELAQSGAANVHSLEPTVDVTTEPQQPHDLSAGSLVTANASPETGDPAKHGSGNDEKGPSEHLADDLSRPLESGDNGREKQPVATSGLIGASDPGSRGERSGDRVGSGHRNEKRSDEPKEGALPNGAQGESPPTEDGGAPPGHANGKAGPATDDDVDDSSRHTAEGDADSSRKEELGHSGRGNSSGDASPGEESSAGSSAGEEPSDLSPLPRGEGEGKGRKDHPESSPGQSPAESGDGSNGHSGEPSGGDKIVSEDAEPDQKAPRTGDETESSNGNGNKGAGKPDDTGSSSANNGGDGQSDSADSSSTGDGGAKGQSDDDPSQGKSKGKKNAA